MPNGTHNGVNQGHAQTLADVAPDVLRAQDDGAQYSAEADSRKRKDIDKAGNGHKPEMTNMDSVPNCPICGKPLKRYGRGSTERKHGKRWICHDENGGFGKTWTADELEEMNHKPAPEKTPAEKPLSELGRDDDAPRRDMEREIYKNTYHADKLHEAYTKLRNDAWGIMPFDDVRFNAAAREYFAAHTAEMRRYVDMQVKDALAVWEGMWGDEPKTHNRAACKQHFCKPETYTAAWAERLATSIEAEPVKPYALQDPSAIIAQLAEQKRDPARSMQGRHEAESEAAIAKALARKGAQNVDELVRDIMHALVPSHWIERVNQYGTVRLIDDCWLRKGASGDIHLEAPELIDGVIVLTIDPHGKPFETVNRGQIIDWLAKRKREAARAQRTPPPFLSKQTAPTGAPLIGVA